MEFGRKGYCYECKVPSEKLFYCPKTLYRAFLWLEALGIDKTHVNAAAGILRLCRKHFNPCDFVNCLQNRLNRTAVPSLCLKTQQLPVKLQSKGATETPMAPISIDVINPDSNVQSKREVTVDTLEKDLDVCKSITMSTPTVSSESNENSRKRNLHDDVLNKVNQCSEQSKDEFSVMGENIANKLRKLSSDKLPIVEKLLTDILFEAQCGNIDQFTRVKLYDTRNITNSLISLNSQIVAKTFSKPMMMHDYL